MKFDKSILGYAGMGITCLSITFMNNTLIWGVMLGIVLIIYGFSHK